MSAGSRSFSFAALLLPLGLALGLASEARAQTPPPEWTCPASFYDAADGCDCDCGALDPDCADAAATVYGCETPNDGCNELGTCRYVPAEWTCNPDWFDTGDTFCDCACGAFDPDCAREGNTLIGCPAEADRCNADGTCHTIPAAWTCSDSFYDAGDGCDCNCGAYDPDCDDAAANLYGCPTGARGCFEDGTCDVVPAGWTCNDDYYNRADGCDCGCGVYDPDCELPGQALLGCPAGAEGCNPDGTCLDIPDGWTCNDSFYDDGTFCDCECGAYDPDCDDAGNSLIGCPADATGCNLDATCDVIPAGWQCSELHYDAADGCDCGCGAPDPDCELPGQTLYGCPAGANGCNPDGTCDVIPPTWTCSDTFYDAGDGCDCDCGAYDPDCDDPAASLYGCDPGATGCFADGTCNYAPEGWTCNATWFSDGQFCDCECGGVDPDCDLPNSTLFGCPQGATGCGVDGTCVLPGTEVPPAWFCNPANYDAADGCDCNCGAYDPDCDLGGQLYGCDQGVTICKDDGTCGDPPSGPPADWTCNAGWYDAADGCDCECGAYDPDCDLPGQTLYGCSADATGCSADATCELPGVVVPPGWTCAPGEYDSGDGCHCECGVYDPDCSDPSLDLKNCPTDAIGCSADAECRLPVCTPDCTGRQCGGDGCGGSCGTCGADASCNASGQCTPNTPDVVPPGWFCAPVRYAAGDACDCECGAYDPDCDDPAAPVAGCGQGLACTANGTCEDPSGPEGWSCDPSYYNAADGCDCGCGSYDPDCDLDGAQLYGCTQGAEGCSADGECIGGAAPPPAGWTCSASLYDAADGCDCGCGIYDPDCDLDEQTLYGCTQDAIGCNAAGECVEPACVPDCAGRECGTDGCGGSCGTCPGGETCNVDGQCTGTANPDPDPQPDPGPEPDPGVPAGWTCDTADYDTGNGCHCGCGAYDPDCNDAAATVVGCAPGALGCDEDGKCVEDCVDSCEGLECGTNACGTVCGICSAEDFCSAENTCLPRVIEEPEPDANRNEPDANLNGDGNGCSATETGTGVPAPTLALSLGLALAVVRRRRRR